MKKVVKVVYGFEANVSKCRDCGRNGDRRRCSRRCERLASYRAKTEFLPETWASLVVDQNPEGSRRVLPAPHNP